MRNLLVRPLTNTNSGYVSGKNNEDYQRGFIEGQVIRGELARAELSMEMSRSSSKVGSHVKKSSAVYTQPILTGSQYFL